MSKKGASRTTWSNSVNVYGLRSVRLGVSLLNQSIKSDLFRLFNRPSIMPTMVNLLVTYKCNSRCSNCHMWQYYRNKPDEARNEMTFEELKAFVDNNKFLQDITLGGGEVFLRDDIVKMWVYLDKNGYRTGATTNALNIQDIIEKETELLSKLSGKNVHTLQISIDGSLETHDRIRGIPGNFDKATQLLKWALDTEKKYPFFQISVSHTICRENYKEFPEFVDSIVHMGLSAKQISFRVAQCAPIVYDNEKKLPEIEDKDELVGLIETVMKKYRDYSKDIFIKGIIRNIKNPKELLIPCYAAFTFCHIDPFWNVYPCVSLDHILGNLRDYDFKMKDFWHSEAMKAIRKKIKKGDCPNCWMRCATARSMVSNTAGILRLAFHEKSRLIKVNHE
jgi:radical SAM protein with 4Fe4S-binding SPASM domain